MAWPVGTPRPDTVLTIAVMRNYHMDMTNVENIIREIPAAVARRVEAIENTGDMRTGWRVIRVLHTITVKAVSETSVAVFVANTRDGRLYGYVASEILDSASDRAGTPVGRIDDDGPVGFVLSWAA